MADSEPEFSVPSLSSQDAADSSSESDEEAHLAVKKSRGPALKVCRYSLLKGYSCKVCLKVVYPNVDDTVIVYRSDNEHTHVPTQPVEGIPMQLKDRIRQMTKQGFTPKRIHVQFTEDKVDPLPALEKIQWFVSRQRKPNSEPVTDLRLREYCELHSEEPEDDEKAFVLAYGIASTKSFYIVLTTKKLLERQLASKQLQADATSSVN